MTEEQNLQSLLEISPDYVGVIFYPKSPRSVAKFNSKSLLKAKFPEKVKKTGVFVNELPRKIIQKAGEFNLDLIQLHGEEGAVQCAEIKNKGFGVIKAFPIGQNFNFDKLIPYIEVVDYFLFDTKGKNYGGNGASFDWGILKTYPFKKSFFLSGGIDMSSIEKLKKIAHLPIHALDINSRFETKPGLKNISEISEFKDKLLLLEHQSN